jgi:hypothetical protein
MQRPYPNGHKFPFGCNGYVTAIFWCQNCYRELSQFASSDSDPTRLRGVTRMKDADILDHVWIQVAVSEARRLQIFNCYIYVVTDIPQQTQVVSSTVPVRTVCNGGGRRPKSTVLFWCCLSSPPQVLRCRGVELKWGGLACCCCGLWR